MCWRLPLLWSYSSCLHFQLLAPLSSLSFLLDITFHALALLLASCHLGKNCRALVNLLRSLFNNSQLLHVEGTMATDDYHPPIKCDSQDHFNDVMETAWAHLLALQPSYTKEEAESFAASCLEFLTFLHYNARFDLDDLYIRKSASTVAFEHSLIVLGSLCTKIHHPDLWSCVCKVWPLHGKTPELSYQLVKDININLWKIHQESFACRFMHVTNLSDFFQDLGIKRSKLLKPISKSPIWHALNIAVQLDCTTLVKGFSTGLAAGCLGLILRRHPLPAYLEGLLQEDVLETIAKFNVASPAIDNLMPFVVEDEEEVVLNANRIVYSLETGLNNLIQDFHFAILKQHITNSGALDGGIAVFKARDTQFIYGTMNLVLEYVLQSRNIITAKKRTFFDLGAIVLYDALRLKAEDAGDFIQHINQCIEELGMCGAWNFATGTGTCPSSWLSSDVRDLISSGFPYFDYYQNKL